MTHRCLPWLVVAAALLAGCRSVPASPAEAAVDAVVLVSANAGWVVVKALHPLEKYATSPFGEFFTRTVSLANGERRTVVVLHGGWGKVSAAASTQYAIDRWNPPLLINLGTCGGFHGGIDRGATVLAARTVIYDIIERMGDADEALRDYSTTIDLAWLDRASPAR